ncbi:MAG: hypothetical protein KDJ22_16415 [Candidatus Competibacteraceae bacterium]|nr:hypothetical protein [Candidatus Competibacteraceae bacterium]
MQVTTCMVSISTWPLRENVRGVWAIRAPVGGSALRIAQPKIVLYGNIDPKKPLDENWRKEHHLAVINIDVSVFAVVLRIKKAVGEDRQGTLS